MYSVVAAAVLATGMPEPGFGGLFGHKHGQDAGCVGCYGGACFGCAGCAGCHGCNGFLGIRSFFSSVFSFGGGGCCGGCIGCMGGCMGCGGCFGCAGGFGYPVMGGFPVGGGMPMASYGDLSMPMAMGPMAVPGGFGGFGTNPMTPPGVWPGQMPGPMPAGPMPAGPMPQSYDSVTPANQATVVVELPADARLFVDGAPMTLTGPVRVFRTPELQSGLKFSYTLKMEVDRGGRVAADTKVVDIEPGKTTRVRFNEPPAGGTARIEIKAPLDARLVVEGQAWPTGQRSIVTPPLETGKNYIYTLKLEQERGGRPETLTREVSFRAGEAVTVDFIDLRQMASASR
jgi:uncharacterized protein (TIGR03000 family)